MPRHEMKKYMLRICSFVCKFIDIRIYSVKTGHKLTETQGSVRTIAVARAAMLFTIVGVGGDI